MEVKEFLTRDGVIVVSQVTISSCEYKKYIAQAERIATLKRLLERTSFISVDEIKTILGIESKKENENETV
jgi:hypothetical protein